MLRKEDFEPNMKTEDKIPGAQTEKSGTESALRGFYREIYAECPGYHGTFSGDIFSGDQ